jgi:hypothetical protein
MICLSQLGRLSLAGERIRDAIAASCVLHVKTKCCVRATSANRNKGSRRETYIAQGGAPYELVIFAVPPEGTNDAAPIKQCGVFFSGVASFQQPGSTLPGK